MVFIKALMMLIGGGAIVGTTYLQTSKDPSEKTVIVSNNHESKIRAGLEKVLNKSLLNTKKTHIQSRKTKSEEYLTSKEKVFNDAKDELKTAYKTLNTEKSTLNTIAKNLESKYTDLITKDHEFKNALVAKMAHDLSENSRQLKLAFYNAQKETQEKEKESIKTKLEKIDSTNSSLSNICGTPDSFVLSTKSTPATTEESAIEQQIKQEIKNICNGITQNTSNINSHNSAAADASDYDNKQTTRNGVIAEIRSKNAEYNLQIIKIKSAESEVQMKLLKLGHAEKAFTDAKIRLQKTENELEILSEQINTK